MGGPSKVAEMTGRHNVTVCNDYESDKENSSKTYTLKKRSAHSQKNINIEERNKFMDGKKLVRFIFNKLFF